MIYLIVNFFFVLGQLNPKIDLLTLLDSFESILIPESSIETHLPFPIKLSNWCQEVR